MSAINRSQRADQAAAFLLGDACLSEDADEIDQQYEVDQHITQELY